MEFITDYKDKDEWRLSFNALAHDTFGIDFEVWYQKGFWSDTYKCYSYLDEGAVVANLSTSELRMMIEGQVFSAVQIGTVMTREGYRGKGYNSSLMQKAIEANENKDLMFLFADAEAIPYYEKYGFKAHKLIHYRLEGKFSSGTRREAVRKLSLSDQEDLRLLKACVTNAKGSDKLDVMDAGSILMWYLTYYHGDHLMYIQDLETVVVGELKESETTYKLLGVYCQNGYNLDVLMDYLLTTEVTSIEFGFTPHDQRAYRTTMDEDPIFIRSRHVFGDLYQYPVLTQT